MILILSQGREPLFKDSVIFDRGECTGDAHRLWDQTEVFKPWLYHLLCDNHWINISKPQTPQLLNRNNNSTFLIRLLWTLNEIMHIKSSIHYMVQSRGSIILNHGQYWHCSIIWYGVEMSLNSRRPYLNFISTAF